MAKKASTTKPKATKKATPKAKSKAKPTKKQVKPKATKEEVEKKAFKETLKQAGISASQVKMLRAFNGARKPLCRGDLKESVGIGRTKKYTQSLLNSLWDLESRRLIGIYVPDEGKRGYEHVRTVAGKKLLDAFDKRYADRTKKALEALKAK